MRWSSASGFWVGWTLRPSIVLQPLAAGADREQPVGAHLQVVVAGLQGVVVEGVALGVGVAARPDHRLMGVLEAAAAEIRHRVGLAPDDVVEDPEAEVLEDRADAEDVVIGADHPERAVRLQHPAAGEQPGAGEVVIGGEALRTCPSRRRRRRPPTGRAGSAALRAGDCRADRRRPRRPRRRAASRSSATQSPLRIVSSQAEACPAFCKRAMNATLYATQQQGGILLPLT